MNAYAEEHGTSFFEAYGYLLSHPIQAMREMDRQACRRAGWDTAQAGAGVFVVGSAAFSLIMSGIDAVRLDRPATVRELVDMMNKRPDVRAGFAEDDALEMLRAVGAEGSHRMEHGTSEILIREEVATRRTVLHEWLHHVIQKRNGGNYTPGEDKIIEGFLDRLSRTLRLE